MQLIWNHVRTEVHLTTVDTEHTQKLAAFALLTKDYSGDGQITVGIRAGRGQRLPKQSFFNHSHLGYSLPILAVVTVFATNICARWCNGSCSPNEAQVAGEDCDLLSHQPLKRHLTRFNSLSRAALGT